VSPDLAGQKVQVMIVKDRDASESSWQILDERYFEVFRDEYYYREDTILLSLEPEKRYFLQISVNEVTEPGSVLMSLWFGGEEILGISGDIEPGDHFYPFYTGQKQDPSKIIGGTNADIADFPWQIYLRTGNYMCGGTIIAPNWILTAAHCTHNPDGTPIPASEMRVRAGSSNPYTGPYEQYLVSQVVVHENYNRQSLFSDLALLKLQTPITATNASPIRLVTPGDANEGATDPGVITWVTGWGLTSVIPEISPVNLQKVQLPIVSIETASQVWSSIPSFTIMAGYRDGNKETCSGDSGGPMVVSVDGEYKIAGIVSWGNTTCSTYSGFTQVSAFESWIRNKTGITEFAPPVPEGDTIVCEGTLSGNYTVAPVADATDYEWDLYPAESGQISWDNENASVDWDSRYYGEATVKVRVTKNGSTSEWSRVNILRGKITSLSSQTGAKTLCPGEALALSINVQGSELNYKWYKDGSLLGTTASLLSISSVGLSNSGVYTCEAEGICGSIVSAPMNVTVHPVTRINYLTPDTTIMIGDNASVRVKAAGHNLSYEWTKNGSPLTDNSAVLQFNDINSQAIGLYQVKVTGTCGFQQSSGSYLYIDNDFSEDEARVSVWPTITASELNVAPEKEDLYRIQIISASGRLMKEITDCQYLTTIDISHIPRGLYILRISSKSYNATRRVIKQ